jgi:hypothetical protein
MKLADKICNLRDMVASPPQGWSLERRVEFFDWQGSRRWIAAREFRSDQGVRRSVREEDGRSELALGEGVQGRPDYGQTTARLLPGYWALQFRRHRDAERLCVRQHA